MSKQSFEGQHVGEFIVLWIEKHWIKYVRALSILSLAGLIPGAIAYGVTILLVGKEVAITNSVFVFLYLYELLVILYTYIVLLSDELDLFIVTNERIVDITQVSLLERKIADTPLEKIQDVAASSKGFLPTILNFGSITVQTAGKTAEFTMNLIPDPFGKSKKILELINMGKTLPPIKEG
jgi:membrane protein YdbS with pleckstrin-like domain